MPRCARRFAVCLSDASTSGPMMGGDSNRVITPKTDVMPSMTASIAAAYSCATCKLNSGDTHRLTTSPSTEISNSPILRNLEVTSKHPQIASLPTIIRRPDRRSPHGAARREIRDCYTGSERTRPRPSLQRGLDHPRQLRLRRHAHVRRLHGAVLEHEQRRRRTHTRNAVAVLGFLSISTFTTFARPA